MTANSPLYYSIGSASPTAGPRGALKCKHYMSNVSITSFSIIYRHTGRRQITANSGPAGDVLSGQEPLQGFLEEERQKIKSRTGPPRTRKALLAPLEVNLMLPVGHRQDRSDQEACSVRQARVKLAADRPMRARLAWVPEHARVEPSRYPD